MFTLTRYTGYDPEMSQYSSATNMGIDYGTYPNVKTVTFGVNVDLGGGTSVKNAPRAAYLEPRVIEKEVIREVPVEVVKEVPVEVVKEVKVPVGHTLDGTYEDDLYFVIGKAELRPDEAFKLGQVSQILKDNPEATITVTGHADTATGTADINRDLSEQRARTVVDMLKKAGIDASRISYSAAGADKDASLSPESNRVAVCIVK